MPAPRQRREHHYTARLAALNQHLAPAENFHWVGQVSELAAVLAPSDRLLQRSVEDRKLADELLLQDGHSPAHHYHHNGFMSGLARRFSAEGDEALFLAGAAAPAQVGVPAELRSLVELIESAPLDVVPGAVAAAIEGGASATAVVTASVLAVTRSTELVADHHGGPVHPISGVFAVLASANQMATAAGEWTGWSTLAAIQLAAMANRHIAVGHKLGGKVAMPDIEPAGSENDGVVAYHGHVAVMSDAIGKQWPNRAERYLLAALAGGEEVVREPLLNALLDHAVMRNTLDDHYFLFPTYAFWALDAIGWEHAPILLRPVVRYLATVPPVGREDVEEWASGSGECSSLLSPRHHAAV